VTAGLVVAYFSAMGRNAGLLLLCLAGLAVIATGCGGSSSSTALRIDLTYGAFGSRSYVLRCSPAAGTFPDAAAVCDAVKADKSLFVSHPGADHSCPYGPPLVRVTGRSRGQKVDAQFSVCTTGQERSAFRWIELGGYGPLWVMQPSGQTSGARVSVGMRIASGISGLYPYGIVRDLRLLPRSPAAAPVFRARVYYGFGPPSRVETYLKAGKYVLSNSVRECLGGCDRLSASRSSCSLAFSATTAQRVRLDVRVKADGTCLIQTEQHG
jgi:hypothetical protein